MGCMDREFGVFRDGQLIARDFCSRAEAETFVIRTLQNQYAVVIAPLCYEHPEPAATCSQCAAEDAAGKGSRS